MKINFKKSRAPVPVLPINKCLAKTDKTRTQIGINIKTHSIITGLVAREILNRLPEWLKIELYPLGSELIAALHDIGKIYPAFQQKIYRNIGIKQNLLIEGVDPEEREKVVGYHPAVSQVTLYEIEECIARIVGRHHGKSPILQTMNSSAEYYGNIEWQKMREDFIEEIKSEMKVGWPIITSEIQEDAISGLVSVSDWISSGMDITDNDINNLDLISKAVDDAGFINPILNKNLSFKDIFGFDCKDVQSTFINSIEPYGIHILEAPMGIGKTEPALYAAYKLMCENKATGFHFFLPTQATSNKMHDRVDEFLEKILGINSPLRKSTLVHGTAKLYGGGELNPNGSWFGTNKRGLLAPFSVGTLDQALMSVMNVSHGFVRTFGLAGKVIILDEIHTYDSYTGTLLDQLIENLKKIKCTVIILSATLTNDRRSSFLGEQTRSIKYPLISTKSQTSLKEYPINIKQNATVKIRTFPYKEQELVIKEAIFRAERGEQVLWIENVVSDAQNVFRYISSKTKVPVGLLHSNFLKQDREKKETEWVSYFGKNCKERKGRILIGTQVLEQSLDIDADFLITRFCPTDMLLQRIGRLWRHERKRPEFAKREIWILSPEYNNVIENGVKIFGKTHFVYNPYVLLRSLKIWEKRDSINIPSDIKNLLEETYKEIDEKGILQDYKKDLLLKKEKLQKMALIGISKGGQTLSDNYAPTRYSDERTVNVLLVIDITHYNDRSVLQFIDGSKITLPKNIVDDKLWRENAKTIQKNTINIEEYKAPDGFNINWLEEYVYLGEEKDLCRIGLVKKDKTILNQNNGKPLEYNLSYDSILGYVALKKKKE